jgi:hypothetical protein
MATDLSADIREAAADGISLEELIGPESADPRAFAAAWAKARGVGRPAPRGQAGNLRIALTGLGALAAITAALAITYRGLSSDGKPHTSSAGRVVGVYVSGANFPDLKTRLSPAHLTRLQGAPTALDVTIGNSGLDTLPLVRISVAIGSRNFARTIHDVPSGPTVVRIPLPSGLPAKFIIRARIQPVIDETNTRNNSAQWQVEVQP